MLCYICIVDDGIGFIQDKKDKKGLGLYSLENRITSIRGKIKITSSIGKGTKLEIII